MEIQTQEQQRFNSYYRANQILKQNNKLLTVLIVLLVASNIASVYIFTQSQWVSVAGQKLEVHRAFADPYQKINAETHAKAFVERMFSFEPSSYEENLSTVQNWANAEVYDKYHNFFYVQKQEDTQQPLYFSWIENDLLIDVEIDEISSFYQEDNTIVVRLKGKQVFKKSFDYDINEASTFEMAAVVEPLQFMSDKNRMGMLITQLVIEESMEENIQN